jgi:hypothetical protein
MHDDELPLPDWDARDLARRAALDSRLQDVVLQHLDGDERWDTTMGVLAEDLVANNEVTAMLARICVVIENLAIWCHNGSRDEAIERFRTDLVQLRKIAMGATS